MILNFIRGFCMALADSVPGVSGGTVAFLLGFYDKFIGSLDALVAGSMQEKKEAIIFLIKIMVGWVVGFLMAVSILASIFDAQIYKISSLFMGFILFAIPIVVKEERANMKFNASSIIAGIIGIAIVPPCEGQPDSRPFRLPRQVWRSPETPGRPYPDTP